MGNRQQVHHHATTGQATRAAPDLEQLLDRVRAAGGRVTTARELVLQVMLTAGTDHLAADEVAARVRTSDPDVHLSTIYRTLESLEDIGILSQARLGDGPVSYHLATDRHHHAICSTCGTVIDLPDDAFVAVTRQLADEHGFIADPHHLTVDGTCAACAAR